MFAYLVHQNYTINSNSEMIAQTRRLDMMPMCEQHQYDEEVSVFPTNFHSFHCIVKATVSRYGTRG